MMESLKICLRMYYHFSQISQISQQISQLFLTEENSDGRSYFLS